MPNDARLLNAFVSALPPEDRPRPFLRDVEALEALGADLPGRLPRLFEKLLLGWAWPEVDLGDFILLENPSGSDLTGWRNAIRQDPVLWGELAPARLVPFARAIHSSSYDPICFDLNHVTSRDCRIIQIDHEEILCNCRVRVVRQVADSFRDLAQRIVGSR